MIKQIVDKYLMKWENHRMNHLPIPIEPEMSDPHQDKNVEWRTWHAVPAEIYAEEIQSLENTIGHKLPVSYIEFLSYKHFYELHIDECSFCGHPIHQWKKHLLKMIFDSWPTEYMIDKGRIPFADWNDWGMLCFDTTAPCENHDYPVVLWDHDANKFEYKYRNFETMLTELDKDDQNNILQSTVN